jgi:hypothetical protein
MQIDLGKKRLAIGGTTVTLVLLVAVFSYSRGTFVKAFRHERQENWSQGIAAAFTPTHFGGVVLTVFGDNARGLVRGRDRATEMVTFDPGPRWTPKTDN